MGLDGIRDAYESGKGSFKMRATARVETIGRRKGIVVTELPYGVGTEKVVERIKTLVQGKKLQGISDIKDLTDRDNGLRLVIEVKNGFVPEALLEQLYRQTPMEDSFGINNVALVDGQPRTLGLKQMLEVFLEHRYDVVRRRSTFRRGKKAERLHLVDGLLIALLDIDEVIAVIRSSDDASAAKERLMGVFDLSVPQAEYILEMQLRRLTRFSRIELEKEQEQLRREIEELDAILADDALLRSVVSEELAEVAKTYGTPRRTVLLESAGTPAAAGYAEESGIPFGQGFVKNAYVGRTFIQPSQTLRQLGLRLKLNALEHMVRGKRLVVVDDSIVRGNTQRAQIRMLREAGALEVHVRISSPPVKWPCFYGIDFATRAELIANGLDVDEIAASVGADSLGYISLEGMIESTGQERSALCTACFTGEYPVELPDESLLGKHLLEATLSSPTMGRALPVLNNP